MSWSALSPASTLGVVAVAVLVLLAPLATAATDRAIVGAQSPGPPTPAGTVLLQPQTATTSDDGAANGSRTAGLYRTGDAASFALDAIADGTYDVRLHARAELYQGARCSVSASTACKRHRI